jgi:hypothetical protein
MLFPADQLPTDAELALARYRRLRALSIELHSGAMKHLGRTAILDHARALGFHVNGRELFLDHQDELDIVFELALHAPRGGRTRPIDRYRKAASFPPGSERGSLLDAICAADFSIWRVERRHDIAGLVVLDVARQRETWLMDEALTKSIDDGESLAARVARPGPFAMTLGVAVPVDGEILEAAFDAIPDGPRKSDHDFVNDPRFALAVYRAALAHGAMENMRFCDPEDLLMKV